MTTTLNASSSSLFIGRVLRLLLPAAVVGLVGCQGRAPASDNPVAARKGALTTGGMSIYVPAYYPSDSSQSSTTTWANFIAGLPDIFNAGGVPVTVIVNGTASEPDATYNPVLADNVAAIQAKGNQVIGYVDWKPKTADCLQTQPRHDCNGRWESQLPIPCTGACIAQYTLDSMYRWAHSPDSASMVQSYNFNGYFVDDAQRGDIGDLVYSELLAASGPRIVQLQAGITLFNPGTYSPVQSLATYVDCNLQNVRGYVQWVDWERLASDLYTDPNAPDPLASSFQWAAAYSNWRFVHLGYGFSLGANWQQSLDDTMTTVARRNAAGVFVTNQPGWGAPPDATLFARQYNNGNTMSYQFQNEVSDTPRCLGACDSSLCATCTCPGPVGIDTQVTFDSGTDVCATIDVTNYTGSRINGWVASVQVDDVILTQTAGAAFAGATHILIASSSTPVDPGQTDSSASFCVARQTPGTGVAGIIAIGSP